MRAIVNKMRLFLIILLFCKCYTQNSLNVYSTNDSIICVINNKSNNVFIINEKDKDSYIIDHNFEYGYEIRGPKFLLGIKNIKWGNKESEFIDIIIESSPYWQPHYGGKISLDEYYRNDKEISFNLNTEYFFNMLNGQHYNKLTLEDILKKRYSKLQFLICYVIYDFEVKSNTHPLFKYAEKLGINKKNIFTSRIKSNEFSIKNPYFKEN